MDILICEDNPVIAMDLGWMLQDMGHHVCGTVATSVKGMEQCALTKPDLVMVDLNLADGRTGLGLVEALAQLCIPTVIVSGETHTLPETTSAKAVVSKPFNEDILAHALAEVEQYYQSPMVEASAGRPEATHGGGRAPARSFWPWRK